MKKMFPFFLIRPFFLYREHRCLHVAVVVVVVGRLVSRTGAYVHSNLFPIDIGRDVGRRPHPLSIDDTPPTTTGAPSVVLVAVIQLSLYPTNNALLTSLRPSSDAEVFC